MTFFFMVLKRAVSFAVEFYKVYYRLCTNFLLQMIYKYILLLGRLPLCYQLFL